MDRCVRYADANLIWPERRRVAVFDPKHSRRFSEFVVHDSSHANFQRLGAGLTASRYKDGAPSFTNCLAVASPIPLFPPAIRAIFPSTLAMQASSELGICTLATKPAWGSPLENCGSGLLARLRIATWCLRLEERAEQRGPPILEVAFPLESAL